MAEIAVPAELFAGEFDVAKVKEWFAAQKAEGISFEDMHLAIDNLNIEHSSQADAEIYKCAEKVLETEWWQL